MPYLDEKGLAHYHENLKPSFVKGVTQAEYDALSEEEQKSGLGRWAERRDGCWRGWRGVLG